MSGHDAYLELAALYAVGALPELERARFEGHLAEGCSECEAELAALRPAVDALAAVVLPAPPSTDLRARVLALAPQPSPAPVRGERAEPPRRAARWPLFAAAATLLLAALFGAQVVSLRSALDESRAQAEDLGRALAAEQETLQQVRAELGDSRAAQQLLTAQVATLEATARVLTAPSTRTVALTGQGPGASARARAFLAPDTRTLILYAYDLPALPADRTYQAWLIPGKVPVPIGVFDPEASGFARHEAAELFGLEAPVTVAVTIEPRGGLPQPSGPIVLAGR